jgi:hypothetical protein
MKGVVAGVVLSGIVVAGAMPLSAASATIKGQVVDQECYLREKQVDADKSCAVSCARDGKPLAILTADGKLYQITGGLAANKNEKLIPHVLHTVEITGDVTSANGRLSIAADTVKMSK